MTFDRVIAEILVVLMLLALGGTSAAAIYWAHQIETYKIAVSKAEEDARTAYGKLYDQQEEFDNERLSHTLKVYEVQGKLDACLKGEKP